jgi:hypothetical protein
MKILLYVVGAIAAVLAVLFAVFTFVIKPRNAAAAAPPLQAAPPPVAPGAVPTAPSGNKLLDGINAAAGLIGSIGSASAALGIKF